MSDVLDSLKPFVDAWCKAEDDKRRREELVRRNEHEIRWIENELATKKLSPAQRGEYRHQIRKKELEIAFNGGNNA